MPRLDKLIEEFRNAVAAKKSSLEFAQAAQLLWSEAKVELKQAGQSNLRAHSWFKTNVGPEYGRSIEVYLALLATGDYRLFEKIDAGALTLYQARDIMGNAKELAKSKAIAYSLALTEVLEFGIKGRRKLNEPIVPPAPNELPEDLGEWAIEVSNSRDFHRKVLALTGYYLNAQLQGVDETERRTIASEFASDVRIAFEDMLRRVRVLRKDIRRFEKIPFSEVVAACETLGIKVPASSVIPVDMEAARSAYRRLSLQLHPDRRSTNVQEAIVRQYTAVQESWKIIQQYNRQGKS